MLTDRQFNFFKSALKRELNGYPAVFDALSLEYVWKLVQARLSSFSWGGFTPKAI